MAKLEDEGAPRKKRGFGTYVIAIAVIALIIGGVVMFTSGKKSSTPTNVTTPAVTTIPQLQNSIASLTATVDGISGRLANLETKVNGLSAPDVTPADIVDLQTSIGNLQESLNTLNATVANISPIETGSLAYWLAQDNSTVRLHILSDKNATFIAEVTVTYDEPQLWLDKDTIYLNATQMEFYANWIPTISGDNTTGWFYNSVTFRTNSFSVVAGVERSPQIEGLYNLPFDYTLSKGDIITVNLLPSLTIGTTESGGDII